MGIIYDIFKALRLKVKKGVVTAFCDVCVCCIGTIGLFVLFMSISRGETRLYIALSALAGALLYFLLASKAVLEVCTAILTAIARFFHMLGKGLVFVEKKIANGLKIIKKHFPNPIKCVRMKRARKKEAYEEAKKAAAEALSPPPEGERTYEEEKVTSHNGGRNRSGGRLRRNKSRRSKAADKSGAGAEK